MTTPAPLPDMSSMNFDQAADALFDHASQQASSDTPGVDDAVTDSTGEQESAATGSEQEAAGETDAAEAKPEGEAEPEQPTEDLDEEIKPDSEDEKRHWYSKSKSYRLQEANKFVQNLQREIPGATIEGLKADTYKAAVADRMVSQYDSGDPAQIGEIVQFFSDPEMTNPQSAAILANGLVERLATLNPEAHTSLQKQMVGQMAQSLYREFAQSGDQAKLLLAQHMDNLATGKYREAGDIQRLTPEQQERQKFQQEKTRFEQERSTEARNARAAFMNETTQVLSDAIDQEILGILPENIRKAYEARPEVMERIRRDFREAVDKRANEDGAFRHRFAAQKQKALSTRAKGDRDQLVSMVRSFTQPILKASRNGILGFYSRNDQSATTAALQQQQQASTKRDAGSAAAATQRGKAGLNLEKISSAASYDDAWAALDAQLPNAS